MHAPGIMSITSSWLLVFLGKQENSGTDERETGYVEKGLRGEKKTGAGFNFIFH